MLALIRGDRVREPDDEPESQQRGRRLPSKRQPITNATTVMTSTAEGATGSERKGATIPCCVSSASRTAEPVAPKTTIWTKISGKPIMVGGRGIVGVEQELDGPDFVSPSVADAERFIDAFGERVREGQGSDGRGGSRRHEDRRVLRVSEPRILAIMGSGETAPTMAKVHRALFERLGPEPVPAVVLDTPYGFQENADDLSARTVRFFQESVGRDVTVASYRSRDVDAVTAATAVARIRAARYVMAGPGSPSYALRQWADGPIPAALADGLRTGGILTMASAAALTLGTVTIPVYEIYKVGADPTWLPGLDLLGPATGLRAAVVPHYDNAEGGNHDTRFCYMGERRLRTLERQLPPGTFILGVDSHTALLLDLDRRLAAVFGLGGVTVRVEGRSTVFPSGSEAGIDTLADVARELATGETVPVLWAPGADGATPLGLAGGLGPRVGAPIRDDMTDLEGAFVAALGRGDGRGAVAALLDLDSAIEARMRAGEDSPDLDNARSTFRALIARLGEAAATAGTDPRSTVEPFVEALLDLRARARDAQDWATADVIRERLIDAGVEVRDGAEHSSWVLAGPPTH